MAAKAHLPQGTLRLLILKVAELGQLHRYPLAPRLQRQTHRARGVLRLACRSRPVTAAATSPLLAGRTCSGRICDVRFARGARTRASGRSRYVSWGSAAEAPRSCSPWSMAFG